MRSIISRKVLTTAAATGILSLTGGFAATVNSVAATGDSPGPDGAQHRQVPMPGNACGSHGRPGDPVAAAVADICHRAARSAVGGGEDGPQGHGDDGPGGYGDDEPGGYGDEGETPPGHTMPPSTPPGHTMPPSTPPGHTMPPSTPPGHTMPPSTPPGEHPSTPPGHSTPPSTPPGEHPGPPGHPTPPGHPGGPGGETPSAPGRPSRPGDRPHLPDTGGDSATLAGAAALGVALLGGGTVLYRRGGRAARAGRH
ncbi:LPXTG cell wall anchor domain-containing protein [Streptomyces sp. NPDC048018]|uniref:LPXTG cell wall anchor domain-containing protein n=1 Tax=Streptomyces sp. NPDC048018 TaxID=3365499 RepID=UPI00371785D5